MISMAKLSVFVLRERTQLRKTLARTELTSSICSERDESRNVRAKVANLYILYLTPELKTCPRGVF